MEGACCKSLKVLIFYKRVCTQYNLITPMKSLYWVLVPSVFEYALYYKIHKLLLIVILFSGYSVNAYLLQGTL